MTALRRLDVALPLAVVLLDQLTKALIRAMLPLHESVTVIPGVLDFTHVRNTGAAFGFLDGVDFPYKTLVIAIVATAALVGIAFYSKGIAGEQPLARVGLALIIGGAAGNLIDRLTVGSVVDFVDAYWREWHFWAFNVADSAITCGVALMILDMAGVRTHVSKTV
jgi:signal peptidase II